MNLFLIPLILLFSQDSFSMQQLPLRSNETEFSSKLCTTQVTTDQATGERTYIGTYPFEIPKGLVKIISNQKLHDVVHHSTPQSLRNINVIISRHRHNNVIVKAVFHKALVQACHNQYSTWVWTPWLDDTSKDFQNYDRTERNDKVRGGNRLEIDLRTPGLYRVTIPHDADLDLKLNYGTIDYKSAEPSVLYIKAAAAIAMIMDAHSGISKIFERTDGQEWCIDWGNDADPKSKLITKNGRISVADEN